MTPQTSFQEFSPHKHITHFFIVIIQPVGVTALKDGTLFHQQPFMKHNSYLTAKLASITVYYIELLNANDAQLFINKQMFCFDWLFPQRWHC